MKIFTIGLSRTGTLSVHEAMRSLGISSVHLPLQDSEMKNIVHAGDITVSCQYQKLHENYPDSLFILTKRTNEQDWLRSIVKHYSGLGIWKAQLSKSQREQLEKAELKIYGTKNPETLKPEQWLQIYLNWEKEVREYFYYSEKKFAVIETGSGKEWNSIFQLFIDNGFPLSYPHTHKS